MLVSLFQHREVSVPIIADVPWPELVKMLTESDATPCTPCPGDKCKSKAEGPLWSPAFYPAGVARKKANAIGVSALVFDLDHTTADELTATVGLLSQWEYLLHSSHRHTDEAPRVRIVLPLAHPVPAADWPAFWQSFADVLPATPDPACKDAGHIYYLPTHPEGSEPLALHNPGEVLDPGEKALPEPSSDTPAPILPPYAGEVDLGAIRERLGSLQTENRDLARRILDGAPMAPHGQHDDTLQRAAGLVAFCAPVTTSPDAAWEIVRESATAMGWTQGVDHLREQFSEKFERARARRAEAMESEKRQNDAIRAIANRGVVDPPEEDAPVVSTQLVYVRSWDKFLFPDTLGEWRTRSPLSRVAATNRLQAYFAARAGHDAEALEALADDKKAAKRLPDHPLCEPVDVIDCAPGKGRIFHAAGVRVLNTYAPPTLVPTPGPWLTIERVVGWLTSNEGVPDDAGAWWLLNWMAAKIQQPGSSMPTAVILNGATASGKGTLLAALFQALGPANCITVNDIDSDFNAHFAAKLLVFADECLVGGSLRDVSQRMKLAITAPEVVVNQKGVQQFSVPNRSAWVFASNADRPMSVEEGDRRYSVFTNFKRPPEDYAAALFGLWESKRQNEPTPAFLAEVAGFTYDMLKLDVDWDVVRLPHRNKSRDSIIAQSVDSGQAFAAAVESIGFEDLAATLEDLHEVPRSQRAGPRGFGFTSRFVYAVYTAWCKANGYRNPLPSAHFGRRLVRSGWVNKRTPGATYWPPEHGRVAAN